MVVVPAPLLMKVPLRLIVAVAVGRMLPSEGLAGVSVGASFTLVTSSEAVSAAALKAVSPPTESVADRSTHWPPAPLVVSQAR